MLVVVGTRLSSRPRFWDRSSEWYLPQVKAMMVSYAEFHMSRSKREAAMERGIHAYLGVGENMLVYLDNGSFAFWRKGLERPVGEYVEFINKAKPDWYPIPTDYIPHPQMSSAEQKALYQKTMKLNLRYAERGYVPVMHAGDWLEQYLEAFERNGLLSTSQIALGGLVPRLLLTKGSAPREQVVDTIRQARESYGGSLHVFGIGGLGTLHLTANLGVDSIDSSGWRNRAARGLILLPGRGERSVVPLSSWRGVEVSDIEREMIEACECWACRRYGLAGLRAWNSRSNRKNRGDGESGFNRRAFHNLWTLLTEAEAVDAKLRAGEYEGWYRHHVVSPVLLRLIEHALRDNTGSVDKR